MRDLSTLIKASLLGEEGKMFWFVEFQFETTVRYTDCDIDLYAETELGGSKNRYYSMPFSVPNINYSASPSVDEITIDIQNVSLLMSATLLNEDISNKWGTIYIGFFDSNNEIVDNLIEIFRGLASKWTLTEMKASITLVNEFVFWNKKTLRKHQGTCPWVFKGTECGYSGSSTCDQSYSKCVSLSNEANYGGFRWLQDLEERKVYWGKET